MFKKFLFVYGILFLVCCCFAEKKGDDILLQQNYPPSTEELISLLGKQQSQAQLKDLVHKYQFTVSKGKILNYESKKSGFIFWASLGNPEKLLILKIIVNKSIYFQDFNLYQGELPFSIKRNVTEEDIATKFNLSRSETMEYKAGDLRYSFLFNNNVLEFIDIVKIEK